MDDKTIMETMLYSVKGTCDLYMHGAIESGSANVHNTFSCALDKALKMQNDIYNKMVSKGWYQVEQVKQPEIEKCKQNYSM